MSDRITWALPLDFRVRLTAILPGVTEADFARLGSMICADTTLGDDGTAHPAFIAWVADVLRRRGGGAAGAAALPSPPRKPAPSGAFMEATK